MKPHPLKPHPFDPSTTAGDICNHYPEWAKHPCWEEKDHPIHQADRIHQDQR